MTVDYPVVPSKKQYVWLFLAVIVFHGMGTWWLPLIDRDEPRFAEASREMIERGDYVVPYFNNKYRFDKPPLTYWFQSTAYRVFGENEWAARLPSVLAAGGVALILLAWGTRLKNVGVGWRAAVIFTLSLQVALHAKAAVADMLLVFFMVLSAWAGWEWAKKRTAGHWWAVLVAGLALGFLAKGPIAWLVLVPVGMGLWQAEEKGRWRRLGGFFLAIIVALGLVAWWGIPALQATDGKFFDVGIGKHVVGRSVKTMEGHGAKSVLGYIATMPFYFATVFASFAPWCFALPALVRGWRKSWSDPNERMLWWYVLLVFGVFSLVKTKLPHYTLPAFPMLAILVACILNEAQVRKVGTWMAGILIALALVAFPFVAKLFPAPHLAEMSREWLKPEMEFASIEFVEPSLVWSFRKTVNGFHHKIPLRKAERWMKKRGPRFYILPTQDVAATFPNLDPTWKVFRHSGLNFAKGKPVDLTMLLKSE